MTVIYRSDEGRRLVEAAYRDALAEWPVSREEMFVETRHGKTFVLASGAIDAPPVVLFQGSSANSALWMNDIVELSAAFRVYAVDVIGEPGLSAPNRPPLGSDAYACWIADVMRGVGITSASFVGVSRWMARARLCHSSSGCGAERRRALSERNRATACELHVQGASMVAARRARPTARPAYADGTDHAGSGSSVCRAHVRRRSTAFPPASRQSAAVW